MDISLAKPQSDNKTKKKVTTKRGMSMPQRGFGGPPMGGRGARGGFGGPGNFGKPFGGAGGYEGAGKQLDFLRTV